MGILGSFGKNIGLMQLFSGLAPLPTGNPQSIPVSSGKRKISSVILQKTFLFRSQENSVNQLINEMDIMKGKEQLLVQQLHTSGMSADLCS